MSDREVLPTGLKPQHYDLALYNLDLTKFTYDGTVVIDYITQEETIDAVHLNYRGLKLTKGTASLVHAKTESTIAVSNFSYNETTEVVTLTLAEPITAPIGSKVQVTIEFAARIWDNMAGFYRSKYTDKDGKEAIMLSTQFESTDARRAFPCADEPNLKATFDFTIAVPEAWTVLGNMPIVSSKPVEDNGKKSASVTSGIKVVKFDTTPIMSTYLVAWAVGDFEYIEAVTERTYGGKKIPIRVYTTRGLVEQGRLALESAVKIIDFYSEVFGIDFVLPKCDLIAVHEFTHGAMENWGLITYRTTAVLFDPETSAAMYKQRVVYVVAHELAHQWFGNLVTMDWWSELWLNEGFATWVGWYAVDHLYPDWDVFSQFVNETLQQALTLDSLRGSHPIEVTVRSGLEIDQLFDHISYCKGASAIRMLSNQLTVKTFLKGVSDYLKKHAFSNARTTDLWQSLGDASGVDVLSVMNNWIKKVGYPLIKVAEDEATGDVTLRQDRFLSTGDVETAENECEWWVPLAIEADGVGASEVEALQSKILEGREIVIPGLAKKDYFKINKDQVGVYRVSYSAERLAKLAKTGLSKLSLKDKVGLIADTAATASAGVGSTTGLLTLLEEFPNEESFIVWSELLTRLDLMRSVWVQHSAVVSSGLKEYTRKLISPALERVGWEFKKSDDYLTTQLRTLLISTAGGAGVPSVVAKAKELFAKHKAGDSDAIHPSVRRAVFTTVLAQSTGAELQEAYEVMRKEIAKPSSVDSRESAVFAVGAVQDDDLIKQSLGMIISGEVPVQDVHILSTQLAKNAKSRQQTWDFIKTNWKQIEGLFTNKIILDRFVRVTVAQYASEENYEDFVAFYKDKDTKGFDRSLAQSLDVVKTRYQWAVRDSAAVEEWLASNKYTEA